MSDIGMVLMSIPEHFRYRNDSFQSAIFVSDIGITDVDVGCRISPTLRLMLMPTYEWPGGFEKNKNIYSESTSLPLDQPRIRPLRDLLQAEF